MAQSPTDARPSSKSIDAPAYSRRSVLAAGAALLAPIGAGCNEVSSEITGGLEIENSWSDTDGWGNVVIGAYIRNTASSRESGTLAAQVDIQEGETLSNSKPVRIQGETAERIEITVEVAFTESLTGYSYTHDVWLE